MTDLFEPQKTYISVRYSDNPEMLKRNETEAFLKNARRQWINQVLKEHEYRKVYIGQFHSKPTEDDLSNRIKVMLKFKRYPRKIGLPSQRVETFKIRVNDMLVEESHLFDTSDREVIPRF